MAKQKLCGLTTDEIFSLIAPEGFNYSHALKVSNIIYKKGTRVLSETGGVSKKLISYLEAVTESGFYDPVSSELSSDGTVKYLFVSPEGLKYESVWLPDKKRNTVCISSQSGCRMGCHFCATGKYGFHGNLGAGDMVNQVIMVSGGTKPTHVVFMGMGEPLDNIENVLKACSILTSEWGLALSPANITISTVGITPAVGEFLKSTQCNLAVSLFSPFSDERKKVLPLESRYPVREIIDMLRSFPAGKKRRFSAAYVMMLGINDSDAHLDALVSLLKGSGIRVNLIPYHPVRGADGKPSSEARMMHFRHRLVMERISASIRRSRGADISAACGLLASGLGK